MEKMSSDNNSRLLSNQVMTFRGMRDQTDYSSTLVIEIIHGIEKLKT